MSKQRQNKYYQTAIEGLRQANKHNPFWTRGDAFALLNLIRSNANKQGV